MKWYDAIQTKEKQMNHIKKSALLVALCGAMPLVHASTSDGKTWAVSAGWLHIMPQSSAQGVSGSTTDKTPILGAQQASSPNAGFEVQNADTAGLMLDYFVNDNVSLELVLGAPPKMDLSGKGEISLPVVGSVANLEQFNKIATTDAYTPTFTARYHFGSINNRIRPYVGAGVMYAHFSNVKADPAINTELQTHNPLVGGLLKPELGKIKVDDAFAPVATVGVDVNLTKNWFGTASVSYAHLSTDAKLNVIGNSNTGDRDTVLLGSSKIEINPVVTYLGLGYRF